ncbi:MAG TPA: S8 family serine peptidase [Myxococcota bacterium]|nr:S8 family serine peptidase [Myxococcota bacterium]
MPISGAMSAQGATPVRAQGLSKTDAAAIRKSPMVKNFAADKAQYIVIESMAARVMLGSRLGFRPFNPNLQQGNGWRVLELTSTEVAALRAGGVGVYPNKKVDVGPPPEATASLEAPRTSLFRDVHQATALQAKEAGWEGEGVTVTIIDTGIGAHDSLMKPAKFDDVKTAQPEDPASDGHGHGTHCSGSATARGDLAAGGIRGMAPKATLQGTKVLDDRGSGTLADVMKGIERAIEWAKTHDGPAVCSMSLGARASGDPDALPMNKLINDAIKNHGIFFAIAAGNSGPGVAESDPGRAKLATTVGATDHKGTTEEGDDTIANFSSGYSSANKPSVSADGVNQVSTLPGNKEGKMSGTSMATPVTAGAAACLLGKAWELFKAGKFKVDPRELVKSGEFEKVLRDSARDNPSVPANREGAGDIRLEAAAKLLVERFGK